MLAQEWVQVPHLMPPPHPGPLLGVPQEQQPLLAPAHGFRAPPLAAGITRIPFQYSSALSVEALRTCSNMSVRVVTTVVILECEDLNEREEKEEFARGRE